MPTIYMIRHGQASAGWGEHPDPDLSELGQKQAEAAAVDFCQKAPMPIVTSPKLRTRQTSEPLCAAWQTTAEVEPRIIEIPSPVNTQDRPAWLKKVMAASWPEQAAGIRQWRTELLHYLQSRQTDTVLFSHFIAINTVVGAALGDDRLVIFRPTYCSVTILTVSSQGLSLVEQGKSSDTKVN